MDPIYLDYNATTPLDPSVSEVIRPFLEGMFGNPSSMHAYGSLAARAVITARNQVASLLNGHPDEVVFTAGGTESNNYAIKGVAYACRDRGNHIITTAIEHPAVIEVCRFLETTGFEVTCVGVDSCGIVDPDEIRRAIRPQTILVSVMHANNETGSIQPITEISRITRDSGILLHTDAAQSVGKIPVDVGELGVDLLSVAGHKLYAPKGVGALYIRRGVKLTKLLHGANHEAGRRAGTENVIGIVGLGKAAELVGSWQLAVLRDRLFDGIREAIPEVRLNGHPELRLPNTLSLGFPGVEAAMLLQAMYGIAASAGAACHAGEEGVSGVLSAMHVPTEYAMGTIRFSVGRMTTEEEIRRAIPIIVKAYKEIRNTKYEIQLSLDPQVPTNPLKGAYSLPFKGRGGEGSSHESGSKSPSGDLGVSSGIHLTEYTHALGCACKIGPQVLEEMLRKLPPATDPKVLVGPGSTDDAAVYQLSEEQALVQTVDVIPPVVDDPYLYGMIAAANALSDVYAMGGQPLFALNIVGFPETRLPLEVLFRIQEGASAKAAEAGIQILGGHSIGLAEPLFGLTVTGLIDPRRVIRNHGLKPGDALVLTKPIGTGILTTALKRGLLDQGQAQVLMDSMAFLNRTAAEKMATFRVHACTDITGFGLLGHLREMIAGDTIDIVVNASSVPLLDGVVEMAVQGIIPGGTMTNLDYVKRFVTWGDHLSEVMQLILCDAQTSGGLVIGLPEEEMGELVTDLQAIGIRSASKIGKVIPGEGKLIIQTEAL